jgi:hypothetical protein
MCSPGVSVCTSSEGLKVHTVGVVEEFGQKRVLGGNTVVIASADRALRAIVDLVLPDVRKNCVTTS